MKKSENEIKEVIPFKNSIKIVRINLTEESKASPPQHLQFPEYHLKHLPYNVWSVSKKTINGNPPQEDLDVRILGQFLEII